MNCSFPFVFLSSSDAITAWSLKNTSIIQQEDNDCQALPAYELASKISLYDSNITPSMLSSSTSSSTQPNLSCISYCQTALCIARSNILTILVVTQNAGLEFWSNISLNGPITSMQFLPHRETSTFISSPIIIVSSEDLKITFWDIQTMCCLHSIHIASSNLFMDLESSSLSEKSSSLSSGVTIYLSCLSSCSNLQIYEVNMHVEDDAKFSSKCLLEHNLTNELNYFKPLDIRFVNGNTSCIIATQNQLLSLNLDYISGFITTTPVPCFNHK